MKIQFIIDIIIINIIYYFNMIKSLFTNIDYLRFIDTKGNIKKHYIPIILNNSFKKIEIKHLNSEKKIISNSLDNLYNYDKQTNNEVLISEFRINNEQNINTLINNYVDDTKIIDIFDLNKINIENESIISITLFKKIPINKKMKFSEISNFTIEKIKSLCYFSPETPSLKAQNDSWDHLKDQNDS